MMKTLILILVATISIPGWSAVDLDHMKGMELKGHVEQVIDGDSLRVRFDDEQIGTMQVRLYGIDAPEHDQAWGDKARKALAFAVGDRRVSVKVMDVDRYGRIVGHVSRLPFHLDVNQWLVRAGHAWVYRKFVQPWTKQWLEDEQRARKRGIGLWRPGLRSVPPWEWRAQASAAR